MAKYTLPIQEKKVYKNSECELCNSMNKPLKLKHNPLTHKDVIVCQECFRGLYLKKEK